MRTEKEMQQAFEWIDCTDCFNWVDTEKGETNMEHTEISTTQFIDNIIVTQVKDEEGTKTVYLHADGTITGGLHGKWCTGEEDPTPIVMEWYQEQTKKFAKLIDSIAYDKYY